MGVVCSDNLFIKDIYESIHPSWIGFLEDGGCEHLNLISKNIDFENMTPPRQRVLNFMKGSLTNVKVVIVGQDPYPQNGVATGRAFEVAGLESWGAKYRNTSLKNILRVLYRLQTGQIKLFKEIVSLIENGKFDILPPHFIFKYWESQGVLLLNSTLTCEIGNPDSHSKLWQGFTDNLFQYISQSNSSAVWFVWGKRALERMSSIKSKKLVSTHPMLCSDKREDDFLYSNETHFEQTKGLVDWIGTKTSGLEGETVEF